jgi:TldD protein
MIAQSSTADTAFRVADRLRNVEGPWDVYGERTREFEIHLGGPVVELTRGPILLEGYGIRLLRARDGKTAVGFQASSDGSDEGIRAVVDDAETVARFSEFPAKDVVLPSTPPRGGPAPTISDPALWVDPPGALDAYIAALVAEFEGKKDVRISFGSIKGLLVETTIANSAGLAASYAHTMVALEVAIKASGGPEGTPAGEYWFTSFSRRLEAGILPLQAEAWSRYARDARRAKSPPTGELNVVLPPSVLESILPAIGFRFSGQAQLRGLSPEVGSRVALPGLELIDDGTVPWGIRSSPVDDEGTPQRRRTLIADGNVGEILYDSMYGNALGHPSTGSGLRADRWGRGVGRRFGDSPDPHLTTLCIAGGTGGTEAELAEAAGDGILVQQLGWASPDSISTAYGGEIRIGYRIRNGKIAEPIRGGTLGGLVFAASGAPSLLANIAGIGSTPELTGQVRVPPLLIRPLTVSSDDRSGPSSVS